MLTNTDPSERDAIQRSFKEAGANNLSYAPDPETLTAERGTTHGAFSDHARYTQQLKNIAYRAYNERTKRGQPPLTNQQKESLEMILHKVGRILAGDANFQDHWDDVGGYAHIANKEF